MCDNEIPCVMKSFLDYLQTPSLVLGAETKESLAIRAEDFLCAESVGNYVKVIYRSATDGKTLTKIIRTSIKRVEEAVASCPFIIRCHRAFLVNLQKVKEICGNLQGCLLRLDGLKLRIPVSRAYAKRVTELAYGVARVTQFRPQWT